MHSGASPVVGRFTVLDTAASGGMGVVYRGLDEETGQPVAIKRLLPGAVHHLPRFEREIAILRELSHPNIVRYVAHGRASVAGAGTLLGEGDELVLVLEWLEGESLGKRLRRVGLGVAESIDLARRVGAALGEAHRRGIVHRDLKPSNVLLEGCDAARPKVHDFGIARRAVLGEELTQAGVVLSTPGYMAPEQARGRHHRRARRRVRARLLAVHVSHGEAPVRRRRRSRGSAAAAAGAGAEPALPPPRPEPGARSAARAPLMSRPRRSARGRALASHPVRFPSMVRIFVICCTRPTA